MRRPEHIDVLGRRIRIRMRLEKSMPEALGEWHAEHSRIDLRRGQQQHDEADTLLHETMHAILAGQGREYGHAVEEMYVRALATGLLTVLRENPAFVAWLTRPFKVPTKEAP